MEAAVICRPRLGADDDRGANGKRFCSGCWTANANEKIARSREGAWNEVAADSILPGSASQTVWVEA